VTASPRPELPPPGFVERFLGHVERLQVARRWEQWHPLGLAIIVGMVTALVGLSRKSVDATVTLVLPTAVTVAAMLAGFLTTAQTLLLVLISTPAVQSLRRSGHFDRLVRFFWEVGRAFICFIGAALVSMAVTVCGGTFPAHDRLLPAVLAGTFVWAALTSVRMSRLITKLLLNKDSARPPA
jgi:hypothetical protein